MVTFVKGDIFNDAAQVITNPINCVGVMGAGLAAQFKDRYPEMYKEYRKRCLMGGVKIGVPYLWEDGEIQILNFPTKRHWKDNSRLEDVEAGLKYLADNYMMMGIYSIAIPQLGCGLGGLKWADVKELINLYFGELTDIEVYAYDNG